MNNLYPKKIVIDKFRSIRDLSFDIGKRLTVISGHNGVGKSNILSLIASGSGISKSSNFGSNFQPEFYDFFYLDVNEPISDYRITTEYADQNDNVCLKKRLSFKNDTKGNRGIRIIPRTEKKDDISTLKEEVHRVLNEYGIGGSARVSIPTTYLSLSRIYPLGESKEKVSIKNVNNRGILYKHNANTVFYQWYNEVISGVLDTNSDKIQMIDKQISRRSSLFIEMGDTHAYSQSIGQDSLGHIISALVDIYILSKEGSYENALLCIDEVDVSLHPDTQLRLLRLLTRLSEEYNFQVIVTTHSLTIIKEISKLEKLSNAKYKLVYLIDSKLPRILKSNEYSIIKANMFNDTRFSNQRSKIYFEDTVGHDLFYELIRVFKMLTDEKRSNTSSTKLFDGCLPSDIDEYFYRVSIMEQFFEPISVSLGCETLLQLVKADNYFERIAIILDGDARIKNGLSVQKPSVADFLDLDFNPNGTNSRKKEVNTTFLPSFFAPESYIYRIIYKMVTKHQDFSLFWYSLGENENTTLYNIQYIKDRFLIEVPTNNSIKNRNWEELWDFIKKSNALFYYFKITENLNDTKEFLDFIKDTSNMLKIVHAREIASKK